MPNSVHNLGLELPTYDEEVPVFVFDIYRGTKGLEESDLTTLRTIRLSPGCLKLPDLKTVLKVADACFEEAATVCEASVVPHQWGLKKRHSASIQPYSSIVPVGYQLVAEVDIIKNVAPKRGKLFQTLKEKTEEYYRNQHEQYGYVWDDCNPSQFTVGAIGAKHGLWLHDIDCDITPS